jgi:phage terminase large subunit-like protein
VLFRSGKRLFLDEKPELAETGSDQGEDVAIGREQPRLETVVLGDDSFGAQVASWAEKFMQVTMMPWQVHALNQQLMTVTGDDGLPDPWGLVHRESLVSTARQNGKSIALTALIGWWLTEMSVLRGKPQNVLSVANRLDRAEGLFTQLAPILVEYFDGKQLAALGRKEVSGVWGRWEIRAASNKLHGGSYDLIVADEIFDIDSGTIDDALRPSQIARKSPLFSMWSTAGDESSLAMMQIRTMCIASIDKQEPSLTYFAEWSMPPGADPKQERWWRWANPALGTTITIEALRAVSKKDSFLRSHLNQWVAARGAWLEMGVWDQLKTTLPMPDGGVLAVEQSLDEARFIGLRSATVDGRTHVTTEFIVDNETEMWSEVQRVMANQKVQLAITPPLEIHLPVNLQKRYCVVGYGELMKFTPTVRTMINEGKVVHYDENLLNEQVSRAVIVKVATGIVLSSQKSPGAIELCRAMVWAVALSSKPQITAKPMLVISR